MTGEEALRRQTGKSFGSLSQGKNIGSEEFCRAGAFRGGCKPLKRLALLSGTANTLLKQGVNGLRQRPVWSQCLLKWLLHGLLDSKFAPLACEVRQSRL